MYLQLNAYITYVIAVTVIGISKCGSLYQYKIITQLTFIGLCMWQNAIFNDEAHLSFMFVYSVCNIS